MFCQPKNGWDNFPNKINNEDEWLEFTDLKDKNGKGKEIYEGDVVEYDYNEFYEKARSVVVWEDGLFMFRPVALIKKGKIEWRPNGGYCTSYINENCKVIGNIYENKELLK